MRVFPGLWGTNSYSPAGHKSLPSLIYLPVCYTPVLNKRCKFCPSWLHCQVAARPSITPLSGCQGPPPGLQGALRRPGPPAGPPPQGSGQTLVPMNTLLSVRLRRTIWRPGSARMSNRCTEQIRPWSDHVCHILWLQKMQFMGQHVS